MDSLVHLAVYFWFGYMEDLSEKEESELTKLYRKNKYEVDSSY
jgi:hypothetical protein